MSDAPRPSGPVDMTPCDAACITVVGPSPLLSAWRALDELRMIEAALPHSPGGPGGSWGIPAGFAEQLLAAAERMCNPNFKDAR